MADVPKDVADAIHSFVLSDSQDAGMSMEAFAERVPMSQLFHAANAAYAAGDRELLEACAKAMRLLLADPATDEFWASQEGLELACAGLAHPAPAVRAATLHIVHTRVARDSFAVEPPARREALVDALFAAMTTSEGEAARRSTEILQDFATRAAPLRATVLARVTAVAEEASGDGERATALLRALDVIAAAGGEEGAAGEARRSGALGVLLRAVSPEAAQRDPLTFLTVVHLVARVARSGEGLAAMREAGTVDALLSCLGLAPPNTRVGEPDPLTAAQAVETLGAVAVAAQRGGASDMADTGLTAVATTLVAARDAGDTALATTAVKVLLVAAAAVPDAAKGVLQRPPAAAAIGGCLRSASAEQRAVAVDALASALEACRGEAEVAASLVTAFVHGDPQPGPAGPSLDGASAELARAARWPGPETRLPCLRLMAALCRDRAAGPRAAVALLGVAGWVEGLLSGGAEVDADTTRARHAVLCTLWEQRDAVGGALDPTVRRRLEQAVDAGPFGRTRSDEAQVYTM